MVKDTEFYDLLEVKPDVDDAGLKRAYRKQAIKFHPDKNPSPDAEEKFKQISLAYQTLSDKNSRAWYDKNGQKTTETQGPDDPAEFFAKTFGGDAFQDYIGEISLMKDMTERADVLMTDEEKAQMEAALAEERGGKPQEAPTSPFSDPPHASSPSPQPTGQATEPMGPTGSTLHRPPASPGNTANNGGLSASNASVGGISPSPTAVNIEHSHSDVSATGEKGTGKRPKMTAEQKEKLRKIDEEKREEQKQRVLKLVEKLKDRVQPFVSAKDPGGAHDPETEAFEAKMRKEAEDLKLESFGIELLHTIGNVYIMKSTSFLKSKKFLGIPGFFSRWKERGALIKDVWGLAMGMQGLVDDMAKLQSGELPEEELRVLEESVTAKILLASWRGTRFEVTQILREVVDQVLKDKTVSEDILLKRAKGLIMIGAIFKQTKPDESDEERRELERLVAEAAKPKKKTKPAKQPHHHHGIHLYRSGSATSTPGSPSVNTGAADTGGLAGTGVPSPAAHSAGPP